MLQPSHRIRVQEKRLVRKLIFAVTLTVIFSVLVVFAGLPLLANVIVFTSSFQSNKSPTEEKEPSYLFPPVLDPLPEATNSGILVVSGYGQKDTEIIIFVNDKKISEIKTDENGAFSAEKVRLSEGDNTITAKVMKDEKESSPSNALTVVYKKSAPKLEIQTPAQDQRIISDSNQLEIVGETEPGNKVTVNDRFVIVNSVGKFTFTVTLSNGENTFKIEATDPAGNKTTEERKVTYSS
ncbi:hypothetical protein HYW55_02780 [Candidatus Gottesmanbacteria bacterium]|nr:hypothetical protein [Candidatus Gottesmanbacteria bacterium]